MLGDFQICISVPLNKMIMKKNKFQMKPKIKKDINHLLTYSFFTETKSMYSLPSIYKKFIQKYLHEKKKQY